jgi:predicted nucleotidyltransferase
LIGANKRKMIQNNSNSLAIIKETANRFLPGCRILLFGSRARKDNHPDSDFDFLVITGETIDIRKKRALKSCMRKELARFKIPADILIQNEEEINSKKNITGHILKQVLKEGVAL